MSFVSFEDADKIVDRFIDLLTKQGVTPAIGSRIEGEFLSPMQLLESTRNLGCLGQNPRLLADAGGMYDLAAKLLAIETQPEFSTFVPHLKLFGSELEFSSVVQPKGGDIRDDVSRKLTELYLGSLSVHFAFDVQLDHPSNSKGDNPDVLFEVRRNDGATERWALAIKTTSSRAGQTIFENIQKAAKQIDAKACSADRGLVVVNLKNSLRHEELWAKTYNGLAEAEAALRAQIDDLVESAQIDRLPSDWDPLFAHRTAPLVLFFGQGVVRVRLEDNREVATILKISTLANPLGLQDQMAELVAYNLNDGMQKILRGSPGVEGKLPE